MKKLWKYLGTLGLMLVACLCLGVGLKASGVSFASDAGESQLVPADGGTACVYIANGKHEMKGGTIGGKTYGIYISGGTFTMSGGTISNCSSYGVYVSGGTFNYNSGTISDEIYLASSKYITLTKAPTQTLKIRLSSTSSGTRVAYLSGISSLTSTQLSYLNVVNMPSGYKLEVQSGYVAIVKEATTTNYTVTVRVSGGGGSVSQTSVSVPYGTTFSASGSTLKFDNGTSVTATADSGYTFDHWSSNSGTITDNNTTIYAYFRQKTVSYGYTVSFDAGEGGDVSESSLSVSSGTTFSAKGETLIFSDGQSVTALAQDGYVFDHWSVTKGEVTENMTIIAIFVAGQRSIIEKIEEGGTINILYWGKSLDFNSYCLLKILIDHPQDFVSYGGYEYVYEWLDDVYQDYDPYGATDYLAKLQDYIQEVKEGMLAFNMICQSGLDTEAAFKEWLNDQNPERIDQYDLILAPRAFVPNTNLYDMGADITDISDIRLGENYYSKNQVVYGFYPQVGVMNLLDYDIGEYLQGWGGGVLDWKYDGDYDPSLGRIDWFASSFMEWLQNLADGINGSDLKGGYGPNSDTMKEYLYYISIQNLDVEQYFDGTHDDYSRPLIFFSLQTDYGHMVDLYTNQGQPIRAVYDISYIVYRLLSAAFGNWFEGYWTVGGVAGFGEQMGAYLRGMSYAKDTLDDVLDMVNMDDFMAISNIACALRNRGIEYWYWKDYQPGNWDDTVPYVYVGVDEFGMIGIMVARQGEYFESFGYEPEIIPGNNGFPTQDYMFMSLNAPFYDNKQYYLFPIKVKK